MSPEFKFEGPLPNGHDELCHDRQDMCPHRLRLLLRHKALNLQTFDSELKPSSLPALEPPDLCPAGVRRRPVPLSRGASTPLALRESTSLFLHQVRRLAGHERAPAGS